MSPTRVDPRLGRAEIQISGFGWPIKPMHPETDIAAPSGGGRSYESDFAGIQYIGTRQTGNPERVTFQIMSRQTNISALRKLNKNGCLFNVFLFYGCADQSVTNFEWGEVFIDCGITSRSASDNVVNRTTQTDPRLMDNLDCSAGIIVEFRPLAHEDISATVSTGAFNDIVALNVIQCGGACGAENDGEQEFIAVGDPQPAATLPRIYYSANNGTSWTQQTLASVANGAAVSVTVAGNRVLVAVTGTNAGLYTALLADVKLGTAVFTLVNGIAAATPVNRVKAVTPSVVVAVGNAGAAWISQDGGFSFTALVTGSAQNLTEIAAADENLIWFGGAAGTLIRYRNLNSLGILAVAGIGADAIGALAIPQGREAELFIGTATGEIWKTQNGYAPLPTWSEINFDKPTGGGIIEDIEFGDTFGAAMFVVQSNASTTSRVLVDYSSGNGGRAMLAIGTFTSPVNAIINAIAPTSMNNALTAGEPETGQGFLGRVSG